MPENGRHVVLMHYSGDSESALLHAVANGCTQMLLDLRNDLTDRQTVSIQSVDVVTAHGSHAVSNFLGSVLVGGPQKAVVITAKVAEKAEAAAGVQSDA